MIEYTRNSSANGMILRTSKGNVRGEAKCEVGSVMRRSIIGRTNITADGDKLTRNATVSNDAEARPAYKFGYSSTWLKISKGNIP